MGKNDIAWDLVFKKKNIISEVEKNKFVYISANELKELSGGREPRLMANIGTLDTRPEIFKKTNLTIFPTKFGQYVIFKDEKNISYYKFDPSIFKEQPTPYHSRAPMSFDTLSGSVLSSESQALDYAFISSLIKTFVGDSDLHLTIRGRLRTGRFCFNLPDAKSKIDINGAQIEIDAGYEGRKKIVVFEAKIGRRSDFHIRQLYYPYLEWTQKTSKEVLPIFFEYSNGVYYFTQFKFNTKFGDLAIVKNKSYVINESPKLHFKSDLIKKIKSGAEPTDIPFPQADDINKVIDLVSVVSQGIDERNSIANYFEFAERQGDYYANAAAYLGLIKRDGPKFTLTLVGNEFVQMEKRSARIGCIIEQMLKIPSLRELFLLFQKFNFDITKIQAKDICNIIVKHRGDLSEVTIRRRMGTIMSWLVWISQNVVPA